MVSATTGHIFTNEAGAIEATGHKVHGVETPDGKLKPEDIQKVLDVHTNVPHQLKQKLVYISNSTEIGTIYTKKNWKIYQIFAKKKSIFIYGWCQIRTRFNGRKQ